jgi:hypothetical protein
MPVYDRFVPTLTTPSAWGYALPAADTSGVRLLGLHGVALERTRTECTANAESFAADSVVSSPTAFQNRRNVRVEGQWRRGDVRLEPGTYVVRLSQPLGVLATYLIDPRSDDGLVAWNIGDRAAQGQLRLSPTRLNAPLPPACGVEPR